MSGETETFGLKSRLAGVAALWVAVLLVWKRCPFPLNFILWALPVIAAVGLVQWKQEQEDESGPGDGRAWLSAPSKQICPRCFTPLGTETVASPRGEAQCGYCRCWFNVHAARLDLGDLPEGGAPAATRRDCPHCAEPLASQAAVSPHGDTKCGRCRAWFNVKGRVVAEKAEAWAPDTRCPRCSAPVLSEVEVSPSGDADCAYCGHWFNIRAGRTA